MLNLTAGWVCIFSKTDDFHRSIVESKDIKLKRDFNYRSVGTPHRPNITMANYSAIKFRYVSFDRMPNLSIFFNFDSFISYRIFEMKGIDINFLDFIIFKKILNMNFHNIPNAIWVPLDCHQFAWSRYN